MFLHRLFSTVILLAFLSGIIFLPYNIRRPVFCVVMLLTAYFLTGEMADIFEKIGCYVYKKFLKCVLMIYVFAEYLFIFIFGCSQYSNLNIFLIFLFLSAATIFTALLFTKNEPVKIRKIFATAVLFYILAIPFHAIINIYKLGEIVVVEKFNLLFLFFILATKIGDIGAYVTGTLSNKLRKGGNHKLVPSISPGKSWEGMFGGWIISILFCYCFLRLAYQTENLVYAIVPGTIFYFAGMAGDLTESVLKRAAGIKDSGKVFPGIGGFYDLTDSLLMTGVIFYFLYFIWNLIIGI